LLVTGAAGFIGSTLLGQAAPANISRTAGLDKRRNPRGEGSFQADIRRRVELNRLPQLKGCRVLIHLAAEAEAITLWPDIGDLFDTNVTGLWNTLDVLKPRTVIFASTCAVYGNTARAAAEPLWSAVRPVGLYGSSKAAGELILRDWARERATSAVIFRFGNVVGPRCRGLIPYLVRHAVAHPDGREPARMRGLGKLVRDYVPVDQVVRTLLEAAGREWPAGSATIFNIGTGRATSNGAIARLVVDHLGTRGLPLPIRFDDPCGPGEARRAILDVTRTAGEFDVPVATVGDVRESVRASIDSHLARLGFSKID
jgi:UDP-glucose 4-epimerase